MMVMCLLYNLCKITPLVWSSWCFWGFWDDPRKLRGIPLRNRFSSLFGCYLVNCILSFGDILMLVSLHHCLKNHDLLQNAHKVYLLQLVLCFKKYIRNILENFIIEIKKQFLYEWIFTWTSCKPLIKDCKFLS